MGLIDLSLFVTFYDKALIYSPNEFLVFLALLSFLIGILLLNGFILISKKIITSSYRLYSEIKHIKSKKQSLKGKFLVVGKVAKLIYESFLFRVNVIVKKVEKVIDKIATEIFLEE